MLWIISIQPSSYAHHYNFIFSSLGLAHALACIKSLSVEMIRLRTSFKVITFLLNKGDLM